MVSTFEYARRLAWARVAMAGGLGTVAGLRLAYQLDLITVEEFARQMEKLPNPPEIVHPSQLRS